MASVNELAYTKIMLHCAAYPHLAVDGLLVGTSEGATIAVVDAVPLFHNGTLAPSVEAASLAVETYAKSAYGGRVVGYYAANEHLRDESIAPAAAPVVIDLEAEATPTASPRPMSAASPGWNPRSAMKPSELPLFDEIEESWLGVSFSEDQELDDVGSPRKRDRSRGRAPTVDAELSTKRRSRHS